MSAKQLLAEVEKNFTTRLQAKTGWGRNEVLEQYRAAVNEALLDCVDQMSIPPVIVSGAALDIDIPSNVSALEQPSPVIKSALPWD